VPVCIVLLGTLSLQRPERARSSRALMFEQAGLRCVSGSRQSAENALKRSELVRE